MSRSDEIIKLVEEGCALQIVGVGLYDFVDTVKTVQRGEYVDMSKYIPGLEEMLLDINELLKKRGEELRSKIKQSVDGSQS